MSVDLVIVAKKSSALWTEVVAGGACGASEIVLAPKRPRNSKEEDDEGRGAAALERPKREREPKVLAVDVEGREASDVGPPM